MAAKNKPKVVFTPASKLEIEAVENGFIVRVGGAGQLQIISGTAIIWNTNDGSPHTHSNPAGVHVFPDFVSLAAWLRNNIRHGKPAKAA